MNVFYRDILRTAWHSIWRHKGLWLFGLFAAFVAEEIETIVRNYVLLTGSSFSLDSVRSFFSADSIGSVFQAYRDLLVISPGSTVISVLIMLAVLVIVLWLVIVSQSALMHSANQLQKKGSYQWSESFGVGVADFWPILAVNVIVKVVDYALLILIGIILASVIETSAFAFGALLILITFVASMILSFIGKYAIAYVVLKGETVTGGLKKGWNLFTTNWLVSIEVAVILFLITIIIGLALFLVAVLIAVPFLLLIWLLQIAGLESGTLLLFNIGTFIILVIIMAAGGALSAYRYVSWTIVFLKLVEGKGESKILRWADALSKHKAPSKV